jgi:hypothetical protein
MVSSYKCFYYFDMVVVTLARCGILKVYTSRAEFVCWAEFEEYEIFGIQVGSLKEPY